MSVRAQTIVVSTGEPAGIGPDIVLSAARDALPVHLCAVGDADLMRQRARDLSVAIDVRTVDRLDEVPLHSAGTLCVLHQPLAAPVRAGRLDATNARYVLSILDTCVSACLGGQADAMVTAPLHKGVINDAGIPFTGHTEYLADKTKSARPVMLLCAGALRVALATTHMPLSAVPAAINGQTIMEVVEILIGDLSRRFGIARPTVGVCGLNPHAGEGGHLGHEDDAIIAPAIERLRQNGHGIMGPLPADTAFTPRILDQVDAVLAMYHDQGLPVLKYAGFGDAVNVTLGLPIVRTSVDHGTALDLAGTGKADDSSLRAALRLAVELAGTSSARAA